MGWLILISVCLMVGTWKVLGFSAMAVVGTITTVMFSAKLVGYFMKPALIAALEGISIFLTIMLRLLFRTFDFKVILIALVLRLMFIGVAYYDDKFYTYFKREEWRR